MPAADVYMCMYITRLYSSSGEIIMSLGSESSGKYIRSFLCTFGVVYICICRKDVAMRACVPYRNEGCVHVIMMRGVYM